MNARPLQGRRVLVLRPEDLAASLAGTLEAHGAEVLTVPAVRILPPEDWDPIDTMLATAPTFDWVAFTSVHGVRSLLDRAAEGGLWPLRLRRVAAIGPATKAALEERGVRVDWMPSRYTTRALAEEFPEPRPALIALVRAAIATSELEEALMARGFYVERFDAYRTEPAAPEAIARAVADGVDAIALTSASIVRAFADAVGGRTPEVGRAAVFCIGPATAEACREAGIRVDGEAAEHTAEGLAAAIAAHFAGAPGSGAVRE